MKLAQMSTSNASARPGHKAAIKISPPRPCITNKPSDAIVSERLHKRRNNGILFACPVLKKEKNKEKEGKEQEKICGDEVTA